MRAYSPYAEQWVARIGVENPCSKAWSVRWSYAKILHMYKSALSGQLMFF